MEIETMVRYKYCFNMGKVRIFVKHEEASGDTSAVLVLLFFLVSVVVFGEMSPKFWKSSKYFLALEGLWPTPFQESKRQAELFFGLELLLNCYVQNFEFSHV